MTANQVIALNRGHTRTHTALAKCFRVNQQLTAFPRKKKPYAYVNQTMTDYMSPEDDAVVCHGTIGTTGLNVKVTHTVNPASTNTHDRRRY